MRGRVPQLRIRVLHDAPVRAGGDFVLYWMIASRRPGWNFALQRAVEWAAELRKPLVVLEPLRCGYRWASDRLHAFVLQGMAEHAAWFRGRPSLYHPYVEDMHGAGKGLLSALGRRACAVVTDEFPCFFLPRMLRAAASQVPVRLEAVDGNGLLPLRAVDTQFPSAYAFRRALQRHLPAHLAQAPQPDPLSDARLPRLKALPPSVTRRWPRASAALLATQVGALRALPIDHAVAPVAGTRGGFQAAGAALQRFLAVKLERYGDGRNDPDEDLGSGLSPYLHFGHLSAHQVLAALAQREAWTPQRLGRQAGGRREGWWGMRAGAEAFLDQLVTWRELGFQFCDKRADYDEFESLPAWAQATLGAHRKDPRAHVYTRVQFERAQTHDALWNAAQRQLLGEGRIHNYLRMLWGKKVLEWTRRPEDALEILIGLNNKHALDGRDPNSYTGIFWCLGRFDRPWAPERPVFGTIRYMSSENTRRKLDVAKYLHRYGS
ncbi:MAG: deoxyribodipyrimidine photolyase [Planctomycetota bacterium]|nr:MAG: deoxyribodipyrimidine photolyase [Planctomycetota bacterium]